MDSLIRSIDRALGRHAPEVPASIEVHRSGGPPVDRHAGVDPAARMARRMRPWLGLHPDLPDLAHRGIPVVAVDDIDHGTARLRFADGRIATVDDRLEPTTEG